MKIKITKSAMLREAKRRARILDRYVGIEAPSAAQDTKAAAELGLSIGSLLRLAAVRRRHRDDTLLVGATAALTFSGGAAEELVMAEEVDLSLVRPERREETLRRIRVLQEYIRATGRSEGDEAAAAIAMGLSVERFRAVLRDWTLHARAELLPGASRRQTAKRPSPTRERRLDILRTSLDQAAEKDTLRAVHKRFEAACLKEGLTPLGLERFYILAQKLRDGGMSSSSRTAPSE